MTEKEAIELINESMEKLKNYNSKAESMYGDLKNLEKNIQEGRELLLKICRGKLFEDEDGRDPQIELLVEEEPINELRSELKVASNIIKRLKGDIL
mgnify:FL=1